MDICHASVSPLTFEQEHKFLQAIKTSHRSTYKKCNFKVDHQVLKNLSQEKSYGYLLQGKSTSFFFFFFLNQKSQMNHLDSSKLYKVATQYSLLKNGC